MSKKPTKIIGMQYNNFIELVDSHEEINLRKAKLIPFYKPGYEMALTSIFLSALRLIKEFRNNIFQSVGMPKGGKIYIFTEIEFLLFDRKRVDGLILIVRGKKIIDCAILEVKNKNNELDRLQISEYLMIAKEYNIQKLITISNQFVSFPTQSPLVIKPPKNIYLYHLSWSYILTIAHILLVDNDMNIADEDQVEIMKEVVSYFESKKSGIIGFTEMKPGWVEISQKANAGTLIKLYDKAVDETVSSWLQEERDMALILSRELGLLVKSGHRKFKKNLKDRVDFEKRELVTKKRLISILQVDGAASNLYIKSFFDRKNIEISITIAAPQDRKTRGQITWIKKQLKLCQKKNEELFTSLERDLMIDINIKYSKNAVRMNWNNFDEAYDRIGEKEIKSFNIVMLKYLGRKFESRRGVVTIIEKMLLNFYQGIVQYIKKWEKPAPKIQNKLEISDQE